MCVCEPAECHFSTVRTKAFLLFFLEIWRRETLLTKGNILMAQRTHRRANDWQRVCNIKPEIIQMRISTRLRHLLDWGDHFFAYRKKMQWKAKCNLQLTKHTVYPMNLYSNMNPLQWPSNSLKCNVIKKMISIDQWSENICPDNPAVVKHYQWQRVNVLPNKRTTPLRVKKKQICSCRRTAGVL